MNSMHEFKAAVLEYADHQILAVDQALREAGIEHPMGAAGVRDLTMLYKTNRDAIVDQMKEHRSNFGWTSAQGTNEEYQKGFIDGMEFMINFVEMSGDD